LNLKPIAFGGNHSGVSWVSYTLLTLGLNRGFPMKSNDRYLRFSAGAGMVTLIFFTVMVIAESLLFLGSSKTTQALGNLIRL